MRNENLITLLTFPVQAIVSFSLSLPLKMKIISTKVRNIDDMGRRILPLKNISRPSKWTQIES